jgi:hypothetical protein
MTSFADQQRDLYVAPGETGFWQAALRDPGSPLFKELARRGELPGAFRLGRRWRVSAVRLGLAVHGTENGGTEHAS